MRLPRLGALPARLNRRKALLALIPALLLLAVVPFVNTATPAAAAGAG